jgi:two-component system, NarL family, response regulator NreC
MTTIVLSDDHHIVRRGLRALLESEHGFKIIGEAGDGLETIRLVESLKPDVLVLDLMMGALNGLDITRQVLSRSPHTSIIILSMYSDESYVIEALRSGAKGYVLKAAPIEELVYAINEVVAGHRFLSSSLSDKALESYVQKSKDNQSDNLTIREREIMQLAVQGNTNAQIAEILCISRRTVESHRASLMRKLGMRKFQDLVYYATTHGIIPVSSYSKPELDEKVSADQGHSAGKKKTASKESGKEL